MPQPSFLNPIGLPFIELQSVDSTNNYAFTQIHAGLAHHGATFFAYEQIVGKGQRGRKWNGEKDKNIILSIVINPHPLLLDQQFQLSACIALSAWELFDRYTGGNVCIKWPNDIYWHDRKAGGILIENIVASSNQLSGWKWAVAGIGININQTIFPEEIKNPVSLKQITGKDHNPADLSRKLCIILNKNFTDLVSNGFDTIYSLYLDHLYKKNELVKFKKGTRVFEALVKKVSKSGTLIVQYATEEEFSFGEVEWLIPVTS